MRLAVVGGGGFRVPLVHAALLAEPDRTVDELVLHDLDAHRLAVIERVLAERAAVRGGAPIPVTATTDLSAAVRGADVVFCAVRPGGARARAADERRAVEAGVLGQETTGAAGVLYALRSVPVSLRIAEAVARLAPDAWTIDFTNPAGVVTEAMSTVLGDRVVGICDSPVALCRRVARVLGVPHEGTRFEYAGLNHLGWLRAAEVDGRDRLPEVWATEDRVASFEEGRLFGRSRLQSLRAVPNEYLAFWYDAAPPDPTRPTRGEQLLAEQDAFYADAGPGALARWEAARSRREATYGAEHRAASEERDAEDLAGAGYEGVALALLRALARDEPTTLVLDVRNRGALPGLDDDAVVEVPCRVDGCGPVPLPTRPLGPAELELVRTVKAVERLTIAAARTGDPALAREALARHPLVGPAAAGRLLP